MRVHSIKVTRATDSWTHSISPFILTINGQTLDRYMTKEEVIKNFELYLEKMK